MSSFTPEILLSDSAWLRSLTRRLTGDADAAADLQQDVAVAALRAGGEPVGRAWLATVARNLAGLVRRRSAREAARLGRLAAPEAAASAADLVATAELQQRAVAAVLALPQVYRDTVLLRFLRGMSLEQTAQHLGVPVETVRTRQKRALAMLRRRLLPLRARAWLGLGTLLSMGSVMKVQITVAAAAAFLLLGLGTAPLWYPPGEPPPVDPPNAASAAAGGLYERAASMPVGSPAQDPERAAVPTPAADPRLPQDPAAATPPGSIAVAVRWADDGSPAANATITCREHGAPAVFGTTDAQGDVRFLDLEPGTYSVRSAAMAMQTVRLAPGAQERVTLKLPRGVTVRGRVVDPDGAPVPFAEIFVMHAGIHPSWPVPSGKADANGAFAIDGIVTNQQVGARHPHWGVSKSPVIRPEPQRGSEPIEIALRFEQAGVAALRGRVVDAAGRAVENAWVEVSRMSVVGVRPDGGIDMPPPPSRTATDERGEFVAEWLGEGGYDLFVYRRGYAPHVRRVEISLLGNPEVEVRIQQGAVLRGTVRDAAGELVAGAFVRAPGLRTPVTNHVRTGVDGAFELRDLPEGELRLEVYHGEHPKITHEVRIEGTREHVWHARFGAGGTVAGRLLDEAGEPIAGWIVTSRPRNGRVARTDRRGRFTLPDVRPEDNVLLFRPAYGRSPIRLRVTGVAASSEERTFRVGADDEPSATLRGQVLDGTGNPLPDCAIHLVQEGEIVHDSTRTRGDGTFSIAPLPPGSYRVLPRHERLRFPPVDRELSPHAEVDLPPIRGSGER